MQVSLRNWVDLAIVGLSLCGTVQAQEDPSFDCKKASTPVEHALCAGGNSGMGWLDQTMSDLYKAALAHAGAQADALRASQRAWLLRRNQCTGSEGKIMNCLLKSYDARYAEIAAPYDEQKITGQYVSKNDSGVLDAVLFPDQTLSANIDASLGAPSYNQCNATLHVPIKSGVAHYVDPDDVDASGAAHCEISVTRVGSAFTVKTAHCDSLCGYGVVLDGTYRR